MTLRSCTIILIAFFAIGCPPEKAESPTKGRLHILIPESVAPPLVREVEAFLTIYGPYGAELTYEVVSSELAVSRFILDTNRLIFTTIPLTTQEEETVRRLAGSMTGIAVAYEALTPVVHHRNPVEQITTSELRGVLDGSIQRWDQLSNARGKQGRIVPAIQDPSDALTYLRTRIGVTGALAKGYQDPPDALTLLNKVVADENMLGIVGQSWIDSARVPAKTLEIAADEAFTDTAFAIPPEAMGKFYAPHPAHVYRNYYPLKRGIYMYTKSLRGDLASGFGTFVANKEGQRIFLEAGLVPATQPIRLRGNE